ncbi:hypothetical protein [Fibrella aquatilis]|uniref:Uncharacterized protein n=1 Tax=Fibrella aquatilis TaxID=2817059 RepID=A0A939K105_9BACT|nr:hypothetical protein [Fibrella aquatilis]MBO0933008.1 hypothetical protein [Fibrella aquatilis]
METNSNNSGAVKNSITNKTIREMTWPELLSLAGKPMTPTEAMRQMKATRAGQKKDK